MPDKAAEDMPGGHHRRVLTAPKHGMRHCKRTRNKAAETGKNNLFSYKTFGNKKQKR